MALRDLPTPRMLPEDGRDEPGGPDLPLTSIPSVPDDALPEAERRGTASHVLVGAALFVLIVAVSVLGARYLKLPGSTFVPAPEEHPVAGGTAADAPAEVAVAPAPDEGAPVSGSAPVPLQVAEAPHPAPAPAEPPTGNAASEIASLRGELGARSQALTEAQRALERERDARRAAERRAEEAARAAASAGAGGKNAKKAEPALDRKTKARLQELEKENARLRKDAGDVQSERERSATLLAAAEGAGTASARKIEAAERRAAAAEAQAREVRASHDSALQGESDAVRKLVGELNTARDQASSEKTARIEAERRAQALEAELARSRGGSAASSGGSRGSVTTGAAAPVAAPRERAHDVVPPDVREPERLRTPPPSYPEELRRARIGGRVLLRLLVDESGNVADVQVKQAPDERLGQIAATAARRWTYTPGRRGGIQARMWITEAVDFKL